MKKLLTILASLTLPILAQEAASPLEKIFSAREPAEFQSAIDQAKKSGVSSQAILEARFLYYVDRKDLPAIANLSAELVQQSKTFNLEDSEIFALKEDWLAIVEYSKSIKALLANDKATFEKHIKEAFWLSPRQAAAFAPHIEKLRLDEAMANLVIPQDIPIKNLITNKSNTLADIRGENKATLLHFWSPWSRETAESFPDFLATSKACTENNIQVISILIDDTPEATNDALAFIKENKATEKGYWATDNKKTSLARTLRISDIPTFALVSTDGKVLFNGHPSDPELWNEIKKLSPSFKRPEQKQPQQ